MKRSASPRRNAHDEPVDPWHVQRNIAALMARIVNKMNLMLLESLRDYGLTNAHFRILQVLYNEDNVTIAELAKRVVITQPVLSRTLVQMEERGLVERRSHAVDSRYKHIVLTDKGRSLYQELWPFAREILETTAHQLTPAEHENLVHLLLKVDAAMNT